MEKGSFPEKAIFTLNLFLWGSVHMYEVFTSCETSIGSCDLMCRDRGGKYTRLGAFLQKGAFFG